MGDAPSTQGDAQHGRLFALRDVRLLMALMAQQSFAQASEIFASLGAVDDAPRDAAEVHAQIDELIAVTSARGVLAFPVDEPLFLLRGRDAATVAGIIGYGVRCEELDATPGHLQRIVAITGAIADWQREHPERMQMPSSPEPTTQEDQ